MITRYICYDIAKFKRKKKKERKGKVSNKLQKGWRKRGKNDYVRAVSMK